MGSLNPHVCHIYITPPAISFLVQLSVLLSVYLGFEELLFLSSIFSKKLRLESLSNVFNISQIVSCKARPLSDAISRGFFHYVEILHYLDTMPVVSFLSNSKNNQRFKC